ncbi:MAG: hypothetical protein OIF51_21945 [Cellvibrionaceae bacterium]|nr:hypothetical protein [Cellvibrionaceae bacterium]
MAQAIPLYLVAAALPPILRARGVDLAVIGGLGIFDAALGAESFLGALC